MAELAVKTHRLNLNSGKELKALFRTATAPAESFLEIHCAVCKVVATVAKREKGFGFVAGVISSDGPQFIDRNMAILEDYTNHIRAGSQTPVMSACDVFHKALLDKYRRARNREEWALFWRGVLSSGITTLNMTPRWMSSYGAKDEHACAENLNIRIWYRDHDPELVEILRGHVPDAMMLHDVMLG